MEKKSMFYADPKHCRVSTRGKWMDAGREGQLYGVMVADREWAIVIWDGDDEPTLFKAEAIEVMEPNWSPL